METMSDVDIVALEQKIRAPFRSGGSKVLDANGKVCLAIDRSYST